MEKINLEPTHENIKSAFSSNRLNRQDEVLSFIDMLNVIEENYTVAVDGAWGSGKTFFIKQIVMVLNTLDNNQVADEDKHYQRIITNYQDKQTQKESKNIPVYFDAWAHDNDDDPLLSLLYSILQNNSLVLANIKDWNNIFFNIAKRFTPSPISKMLETYADCKGVDLLSELKEAHDVHTVINDFFSKLSGESENIRTVIFIDELDRCKPSYAVKLLERIKHFFIHKNITFVFSTNLLELQHTVKQCYGVNFNGYQYLDRFFDFIYALPSPTKEEETSLYHMFRETRMTDVAQSFFQVYNIPLRQRLKIVQAIVTFHNNINFRHGDYFAEFQNAVIVPLLICLRYCDINTYNQFIEGKNSSVLVEVCFNQNLFLPIYKYRLEILFDKQDTPSDNEIKAKYIELYELIFQDKVTSSEPITVGQVAVYHRAKERILTQMHKFSKFKNS